ncbi:MAG: calcium-binding protein, partial [Desulfobacteraceae bacterium]|nr:calcium-binding protein [Desulfobacteraceae bacterium]
TEDGGTATFTVRLNGIPTADVTIGVSSSDTTEGTVDVISLTFTSDNWNANQTVTVKGVNDDIVDGNQGYDIVLSSAASSDNNYNGLNPQDVSVSNTDNNTPGFEIEPLSGLTTTEAGVTETFTVKLQSQPSADVTIGVSSSDTGEGTVDVTSLTFTSVNWNANQTVTVTGINDDIVDGDQSYNIVLAEATSADSDYNGENPPDVSLKNTDNDTPGFIVEAISGDTTESSGTATFTVTLQSQPTADVTIGISSSDDEEGTADLTSLTFTAANWNATSHIVTVTGEDDSITDGDQEYSIILSTATSLDLSYNGRDPDDVTVVNIDDDIPGFIVGAGGDTSEDGGTEGFTVSLQSQPTADVTISVTSENTEEGTVNKSSLVFTPDNWNANQTVTVSGIDDSIIDGNQNYTVALGSAVSDDDNYKDLNPPDVVMTNIDNDTAGFIVGTIDDDTTEDGGTAVFSVRLKTKPAVNVSVNVESQNTGEGTASPSTLLFTPDDWSILHYVTITGIDDDIMDGTQPYNIVLSAAVSSDGNYNNVTPSPNSIAVNNLDNDSPGFIIYPNTGLTTTEDGGTDSFTVRLISQPIADVTIGISSLDDSEGSVSPASLTFKSTNWNTEQPVTVTGLDDSIADGNQSYTIVTTEAVSTDPDYSGQYPGNVAAVNIDNDSAVCDVSGDIDGNRRVDLADAILGLRILAGIDYSVNIACDVNGDGQISIEDVLYALRKELGME